MDSGDDDVIEGEVTIKKLFDNIAKTMRTDRPKFDQFESKFEEKKMTTLDELQKLKKEELK